MNNREKDIQELCKQVKNASVLPESGDCGYTMCPFCYAYGPWNADTVDEIQHDPDCAYLIAKDLSTGMINQKKESC